VHGCPLSQQAHIAVQRHGADGLDDLAQGLRDFLHEVQSVLSGAQRNDRALTGPWKTTLVRVMLDTIVCVVADAFVSILMSCSTMFASWPATRLTRPENTASAVEAMAKNFMVIESGGLRLVMGEWGRLGVRVRS
jgi:hypothetical protein